jgi:hypothetical protein
MRLAPLASHSLDPLQAGALRFQDPEVVLIDVKLSNYVPGMDKDHLPGFYPASRAINEDLVPARGKRSITLFMCGQRGYKENSS